MKFILRYRDWSRGKLTLLQLSQRIDAVTGYKPSTETINKWLHGKVNPTPDNLEKIAETLEVTESWLRFGE